MNEKKEHKDFNDYLEGKNIVVRIILSILFVILTVVAGQLSLYFIYLLVKFFLNLF